MRYMKLIFIIEYSKLGGGDISIFRFAEALAKLGHKIVIFTSNYPQALELDRYNLRILSRYSIPRLFKGCGKLDKFSERVFDFIVLNRFLKMAYGIDYIVGYQRSSAIKAVKLGKKYDIPVVNFIFECPTWLEKELSEDWLKHYRKPSMKKSWDMFRSSLLDTDIIFANSNLTKEESEKWLNKKVDSAIYPGIETSVVNSIPKQNLEHQIIYVGRLYKDKNIDDVIKALALLDNSPKFVVCGKGGEKQTLQKLATKLKVDCEFKGIVTESEKWKEIKKSKFMVFPTSFEGFGMPPMEALYCERPCIVSDIPILNEVYGDKVEYVRLHDINGLAKKMQCLLDKPEYCKVRGESGKKYIHEKYIWKQSAEKIATVLQQNLLRNKGD